jgi:hypothetical protein
MNMLLRGTVTKQLTNETERAAMHVICFLFVPLGSSTVQLHESLGSRRASACLEVCFSTQNGGHAWRVHYRKTALCSAWAKVLNAKDIHKENVLFMLGSVCRVTRLTTGMKILSRTFESRRWCPARCKTGWDNRQNTSMLRIMTH